MNIFAGVFFKMQTRNLDRHRLPVVRMAGLVTIGGHDFERAVG